METTVTEAVAAAASKAASGIAAPRKTIVAGIAYTVTPDDHGATIQCATHQSVVSLPTGLPSGFRCRVQNIGADLAALVSISPAAAHRIRGTVVGGATGVPVQSSGALDKDWTNPQGTAEQGDYTDLEYAGGDTWWIIGGTGVWASEA